MGWWVAFLLLVIVYTKKADFDNPASYAIWCATMFIVMVAFVLWGVSYAMIVEQYPILDIFAFAILLDSTTGLFLY